VGVVPTQPTSPRGEREGGPPATTSRSQSLVFLLECAPMGMPQGSEAGTPNVEASGRLVRPTTLYPPLHASCKPCVCACAREKTREEQGERNRERGRGRERGGGEEGVRCVVHGGRTWMMTSDESSTLNSSPQMRLDCPFMKGASLTASRKRKPSSSAGMTYLRGGGVEEVGLMRRGQDAAGLHASRTAAMHAGRQA
jgi:hypothetical protein